MAKTQDEIKELLSTELFKSGIANNYKPFDAISSTGQPHQNLALSRI